MASTADSIASRGKNSPLRRRILSCAKFWPLSVFAGLPAVCCCVGVAARSLDHLFIAAAAAAAAADPAQRAAETGATDPAGPTTHRVSLLVRDLLRRRRSAPSARLELILTRPGPVRSAGLV